MTRSQRTPVKRRVLTAAALLFATVLTPQSATAAAQPVAHNAPAAEAAPVAEEGQPVEDVAADPHGLKKTVADYRTRVPAKYTTGSWKSFAKALTTADDVAKNPSASATEAAAAKTALVTAAADLVAADEGTFQTITNNTFWNDTSGNPIYSQGGGVFKFGDTYYWYGVHYRGAESYRANPTRKYDGEVSFVSIPCTRPGTW